MKLLLPAVLAALSTAAAAPPPSPVLRFPIEGGGEAATVCGLPKPADGTASSAAEELLRAQVREVAGTLNIPARSWYGPGGWINDTTLGPWRGGVLQTVELTRPRRVSGTDCVRVDGGVVDAAGPGMVFVSADNGTSWSNGTRAEWFESVAVAFGLRPYIAEETATLLVSADESVVKASHAVGSSSHAKISMELPFASPPRTETWTAQQHAALHREQTVLSFPLDGLPDTINQDVKVTITLPRGQRITKLKRLMRAPPLPSTSSALPVQVDHSTRGLRVDGRPYLGVGWYLDGLAGAGDGSGFATFDNL